MHIVGYPSTDAMKAHTIMYHMLGDGRFDMYYDMVNLIAGEGRMQLTIQAISDFHRYGCKPVVFLIENGGYMVDRLLHGKTAPYYALPTLDYAKLGGVFGPEYKSLYFGPIDTSENLEAVLKSEELNDTERLRVSL